MYTNIIKYDMNKNVLHTFVIYTWYVLCMMSCVLLMFYEKAKCYERLLYYDKWLRKKTGL